MDSANRLGIVNYESIGVHPLFTTVKLLEVGYDRAMDLWVDVAVLQDVVT
jgi:hypothetical protein